MPFTTIEEPQLKTLTAAFGAITVYAPSQELVPEQMRHWQARELLNIKYPQGVDGDQLNAFIHEYKAWADLHQGSIVDMAGFFKFRRDRFAMVEATNPTQISHQIRHYSDPPAQDSKDLLLDAAVFLSLSQEFDAHHYAMDREMDAVQAMEHQMMRQLSPDAADEGVELQIAPTSPASRDQALDPHMISHRVRAWSRLVIDSSPLPWLYLTPSQAAIDHALDLFPAAEEVFNQALPTSGNESMLPPTSLQEMVQALAFESDSRAIEPDSDIGIPLAAGQGRLILYRVTGILPRIFLATLGALELGDETADGQGPAHTLVGLVTATSG
jgi:hypothetical protein